MVEKERKSPFIHYFDKTPEGIRCPHFWILSASLGCAYFCKYCYLNLSLRYQKGELPIFYSNQDKMVGEVSEWLEKTETPSVLNCGELSDSLAFEKKLHLLDRLVPLFEKQSKHKLLLLTKSADRDIDFLNFHKPTSQVVLSWSVNCNQVWQDYEKSAPNPFERLSAAYTYMRRGWKVRIRIDPIVPIEDWTSEYNRIVEVINMLPSPNFRVTLGTIRCFPTLKNFCPPSGVFNHCIDNGDPDRRLRLPFPVRKSIYQWFARRLKVKVALCKETEKMIEETNLKSPCNCML